jgi:putative membrane protein
MWGYGDNMMGSGWGWLMGAVLIVLLIIAVIVVLRLVPRRASGSSGSNRPAGEGISSPPLTPRQILDDRYARGVITTEEFRERLQNLGSA